MKTVALMLNFSVVTILRSLTSDTTNI